MQQQTPLIEIDPSKHEIDHAAVELSGPIENVRQAAIQTVRVLFFSEITVFQTVIGHLQWIAATAGATLQLKILQGSWSMVHGRQGSRPTFIEDGNQHTAKCPSYEAS
jgi:hypothetical protein